MGQNILDTIEECDISLLSQNRIVNLAKLFPYIPDSLNNIMMHFSKSSPVFYETVDELYDDLADAIELLY